jgi:uncharacterized coiled-coil protein SlyX
MTQGLKDESAASANPWRRARSPVGDGRTSLVFWLMMLVLGGVAWGAVTWAASNLLAKKGPEKLLRVEQLLPKLNISHTSEPHPSDLAHPKDRPTSALHLPTLFGHSQVKVVETPAHVEPPASTPRPTNESWLNPVAKVMPPVVEACEEPVVYVQPCTLQPGDTPMMRTWKTVTMYSLLAGAVTLAPPPLLAEGDKGIQDKTEALEKLQKSLDALTKRIKSLEEKPAVDEQGIIKAIRADLKKLEEGALSDISKDMGALKTEQLKQKVQIDDLAAQIESLRKKMLASEKAAPTPTVDKAFMEELREIRGAIKSLQDTIAKLGPIEKRDSAYPNGNGNSAARKTGRVLLANFYNDELLFIINGNSYRLAPRTTRVVENVPIGDIRYEVFATGIGVVESRITTLAAGDTFTLTAANPR